MNEKDEYTVNAWIEYEVARKSDGKVADLSHRELVGPDRVLIRELVNLPLEDRCFLVPATVGKVSVVNAINCLTEEDWR